MTDLEPASVFISAEWIGSAELKRMATSTKEKQALFLHTGVPLRDEWIRCNLPGAWTLSLH